MRQVVFLVLGTCAGLFGGRALVMQHYARKNADILTQAVATLRSSGVMSTSYHTVYAISHRAHVLMRTQHRHPSTAWIHLRRRGSFYRWPPRCLLFPPSSSHRGGDPHLECTRCSPVRCVCIVSLARDSAWIAQPLRLLLDHHRRNVERCFRMHCRVLQASATIVGIAAVLGRHP